MQMLYSPGPPLTKIVESIILTIYKQQCIKKLMLLSIYDFFFFIDRFDNRICLECNTHTHTHSRYRRLKCCMLGGGCEGE